MTKWLSPIMAGAFLLALPATAFAEGDVAKGEKVFKKCKTCHVVEKDSTKKKPGPNLFGVIGRAAASNEAFAKKYGKLIKAAAAAGLVWNEELLDKYLDKKGMTPTLKGFVEANGGEAKGKSKMTFVGLKKKKDRDNVIAYLKTLSGG